jgi:hypothetical protein
VTSAETTAAPPSEASGENPLVAKSESSSGLLSNSESYEKEHGAGEGGSGH